MPIVQLLFGDCPAVGLGGFLDGGADMADACQYRTFPSPTQFHNTRRPRLLVYGFCATGNAFQHAVSHIIHQRHQKMPTPHCRIADFEFQNVACRVEVIQGFPIGGIQCAFFTQCLQVFGECGIASASQFSHRFLQNQTHQIIMRVIATRYFAGKTGRHGNQTLAGIVPHQAVIQ